MPFTCPRCQRTSQSPRDAREGYCGACRDWTGEGVTRFYQCESCGCRTAVPLEHAGRVWCPCGSARAMAPAPWIGLSTEPVTVSGRLSPELFALITGSQQRPGTDSECPPADCAVRQREVDEFGWDSAATWHSGDPAW